MEGGKNKKEIQTISNKRSYNKEEILREEKRNLVDGQNKVKKNNIHLREIIWEEIKKEKITKRKIKLFNIDDIEK